MIFCVGKIGWFLSNVTNANAVTFYAKYAIQKDMKAIKGNVSLLEEEWIDMSNIIVMILETIGYDFQS